ncbi:MAG: phosphate acyltransferase PlsX [Deltaproteobacteria bacterium]|nr:phosphate acyltransferase PlsX [Deltaproteobacteria bacterium]
MGNEPIIIAVDAMGGDHAPNTNIQGALLALEEEENLRVLLVGQTEEIQRELGKSKTSRLEIVHADEIISMDDHASAAIRKKKGSSIHVGLELVSAGKAHAFISAGNSGAVMAIALKVLSRLAGVERPAILIKLPTAEGFSIVLDVGANVDSRPRHLVDFAQMGHIYAEVIEGIKKPRIGLLSNASESHKGTELTRETDALLRARTDLNYMGYVEGFDLFRGTADVIVCDGFVGNVLLKSAEGFADTCFQWFRKAIKKDILGWLGVALLYRLFRNFRKKFDYQPYGAAPLLGINGMVLISHGSSTKIAMRNGILTAKRGVEQDFMAKIAAYLEFHQNSERGDRS